MWQNITVLQFLRGGGSGQYITVYYIGGGSRKGPKKYYVIFAQPLIIQEGVQGAQCTAHRPGPGPGETCVTTQIKPKP